MQLGNLRQRMLKLRDSVAPSGRYRVKVGGTILINDDGITYPKVRALSESQSILLPGYTEGSIVYSVRIVSDAPIAMGNVELSVDNGATWKPCRMLGSAKRDVGNNAWIIRIEQGANRGS